jgi:hypothetical protein
VHPDVVLPVQQLALEGVEEHRRRLLAKANRGTQSLSACKQYGCVLIAKEQCQEYERI